MPVWSTSEKIGHSGACERQNKEGQPRKTNIIKATRLMYAERTWSKTRDGMCIAAANAALLVHVKIYRFS